MNDKDMRRRIEAILDGLRLKNKQLQQVGKAAGLAVAVGASSKALNGCLPVAMYAAPVEDASVDGGQIDQDASSASDANTVADAATVMYAAPIDAGSDDMGAVPAYALPMDAGLDDMGNVALYAAEMPDASLEDLGAVAEYAAPMDAGLDDMANVALYAVQMDDAGVGEDVDGFVVRYGAPQDGG